MPPEYRFGYDEIAAAISRNDQAVNPDEHMGPAETAEELLDPVGTVLKKFGIDPEGVTEASFQRSIRIAESGEIDALTIMHGGFALMASWGAAWMDGFAAALSLLAGEQEDRTEVDTAS